MMASADNYKSFLPEELPATNLDDIENSRTPLSRDARDGKVYVIDDDLRLAVDVAIATSRPLLLRGEPGSGKSSLAPYIARALGWRYYEYVITSRTTARNLLWSFDSVQKLADASAHGHSRILRDSDYIDPGVLWWAIDRDSARRRGLPEEAPPPRLAEEPNAATNDGRARNCAVVLLDEIDKADPEVPNGLLVPLGSYEFRVLETGVLVRPQESLEYDKMHRILVILTTNEERELPGAFLRRCVTYTLTPPDREKLIEIGRLHRAASAYIRNKVSDELLVDIARVVVQLRETEPGLGARTPSAAEYLDAVWACASLGIDVHHPDWLFIRRHVLEKQRPTHPGLF